MDLSVKKKKVGRPTKYTANFAHEFCEMVAVTSKGVKTLCKENPHWPNSDTIYSWLAKYKQFSDLYARAKRQQIEVIVDEILTIADDSSIDSVINDEGRLVVDHEHINRAKLRIDTRKWLAAKLVPRLYGAVNDAPVNLNFPTDLSNATALLPMSEEIFRSLANQEITPDQANVLMNTLKTYCTNILIIKLAKEMEEMKQEFNMRNK
jgi:hypothetical protein